MNHDISHVGNLPHESVPHFGSYIMTLLHSGNENGEIITSEWNQISERKRKRLHHYTKDYEKFNRLLEIHYTKFRSRSNYVL